MGQQFLKASIVTYPPDDERVLVIEQQTVAHLQPLDVAVPHANLNGLASCQNEPQVFIFDPQRFGVHPITAGPAKVPVTYLLLTQMSLTCLCA